MKRSTKFRRPTINDVASLSGVSKATVSNVVRETGSVSEATRARVLDAIATLRYRPNAAARNLARQRTDVLGVVVGNFGNAFNAEMVEQIEYAASERKFTTLVCTTGRHPEDEATKIAALLEQRVAGIAMLQFSGDRRLMTQLLAEHVPVVMVSCWDDYTDCVAVDDFAGLELAVGHLTGLGHRRIAYVTDELVENTTRRVRLDAFERALLRHGLDFHRDWVIHGDLGGAEPDRLNALFESTDHPDAIVATNDNIAITLIEQLEARGRRVPEDVSIVGFDGSRVGGLSRIALTTIAQPVERLARSSLDLVLERIASPTLAARRHVRLEPRLIVRESTAPAGSRAGSVRKEAGERGVSDSSGLGREGGGKVSMPAERWRASWAGGEPQAGAAGAAPAAADPTTNKTRSSTSPGVL
ncbi:MAG: LacI family DNA-binding transcriptional regulator [Solirubrobacteraceae bacterium]